METPDSRVQEMQEALESLLASEPTDIEEPTLVDQALDESQMAWYIAYST